METIIRYAILYAALSAASAPCLYAQSVKDTLAQYQRFVKPDSQRGGDPAEVVTPHDADAGDAESDSGETSPVSQPAITIAVAPFFCAPCNALKAMDWSGFDVTWQTGGAAAFPEISWLDDRGVKRTLTGAYRPDQVLWSWQQTQADGHGAGSVSRHKQASSGGGSSTAPSAAQAPTPYSKIAEGLEYAGLDPGETMIDIGCGDGRVLMVAAEQFNAKATGIELDVNLAALTRERLSRAGLIDRTDVIDGDATAIDLPAADVAYVYLYPDTLLALKPKLKQFETVVSYMHQVPGLEMQKRGDFYIWRKLHQPVQPAVQQRPVAVWGGRQYSGPVCNSPGCRMCASIRSQLYGRR